METTIETESGQILGLLSLIVVARSEGTKVGDRTGLDAARMGLAFDSWPGIDYASDQVERVLWRELGVHMSLLTADQMAQVVNAYIDGFRTGYAEAWDMDL